MRGQRLWLKVEAHGGTLPVYVVKGDLYNSDGETEVEAYYDRETPCIKIKQIDNIALMKQTLHHELLHLCFGVHSGDARAAVFRSKTTEGRYRREEEIVSFLEPIQFDLLVRNGWLKYPNPPKVK